MLFNTWNYRALKHTHSQANLKAVKAKVLNFVTILFRFIIFWLTFCGSFYIFRVIFFLFSCMRDVTESEKLANNLVPSRAAIPLLSDWCDMMGVTTLASVSSDERVRKSRGTTDVDKIWGRTIHCYPANIIFAIINHTVTQDSFPGGEYGEFSISILEVVSEPEGLGRHSQSNSCSEWFTVGIPEILKYI